MLTGTTVRRIPASFSGVIRVSSSFFRISSLSGTAMVSSRPVKLSPFRLYLTLSRYGL